VILSQFLGEATTLCLLGGVIGIILGSAISTIMAVLGNWPTTVSLLTILTALAASAFVGIFFGYYPARKASRLNPIEALRYE
jgi:ABC-type antimicrobial peptide transport system permease subunit